MFHKPQHHLLRYQSKTFNSNPKIQTHHISYPSASVVTTNTMPPLYHTISTKFTYPNTRSMPSEIRTVQVPMFSNTMKVFGLKDAGSAKYEWIELKIPVGVRVGRVFWFHRKIWLMDDWLMWEKYWWGELSWRIVGFGVRWCECRWGTKQSPG